MLKFCLSLHKVIYTRCDLQVFDWPTLLQKLSWVQLFSRLSVQVKLMTMNEILEFVSRSLFICLFFMKCTLRDQLIRKTVVYNLEAVYGTFPLLAKTEKLNRLTD